MYDAEAPMTSCRRSTAAFASSFRTIPPHSGAVVSRPCWQIVRSETGYRTRLDGGSHGLFLVAAPSSSELPGAGVRFAALRWSWAAVCAALCGIGLLFPAAAEGQSEPTRSPALLLILDASGSMNADDGSGHPKIDAAKDALRRLVDTLPPGAPVGLRVYGHRVPNTDKTNGCRDTQLIAPVAPLDREQMKVAIGSFNAKGYTPIGLSLQEAAKDLPPDADRTVVLVSDGVDTCAPPDPCEVAKGIAAQGVRLKIEAVGFQVDAAAREQLRCIAAATGGTYADAPDAARLGQVISVTSQRALRTYKPRGKTVNGGKTKETAEALDPGIYQFTKPIGEQRWFSVRLEKGQALDATLTAPGGAQWASTSNWRHLTLELFNPAGERATFSVLTLRDIPTTGRVRAGPIGSPTGVSSRDALVAQPGVYLLRLLDEQDVTKPAELLTEMVVDVTGGAPAAASAQSATARDGVAPAAAAGGSRDTSDRVLNALVAAFVGLLAGAAGAFVLIPRLRR
jgi:Ca-activated chloride channel family protein